MTDRENIPPPPRFALTDGEKANPLWLRLQTELKRRLDAARCANDAVQPEAATSALRGEIKSLKGLIALGEEGPTHGNAGGK